MKQLKSPITVILFPGTSDYVNAFHSKLREEFYFELTDNHAPLQVGGATSVVVDRGSFKCFSDPIVKRFEWLDPLDEQDIVLLTSDQSVLAPGELQDILNFSCPPDSPQIVTVVAQPDSELDSGARVSVATSHTDDADNLDSEIRLYDGNKIFGAPAVLLGLAKELDRRAFCIVIEYAPQNEFASSTVLEEALHTFSRVCHFELRRSEMSEQAIRMHKHLKALAKKQNQEYQAKQAGADYVWLDLADHETVPEASKCVEAELRRAENLEWIEKLFNEISSNGNDVDPECAMFLKSELDRLGLFAFFEGRFLALFSSDDKPND